MSTSPFGSPPPPAPSEAPAPAPAPAATRPTALLVVLGAVVALAAAGGAAFLLLSGDDGDVPVPTSVLATPVATPTPSPPPSPTAAPARQVSAVRNPFTPLIAPAAPAAAAPDPAAAAVGAAAVPAGSPAAPAAGSGSTAKPAKPATPTPSPAPSAPAGMDLPETCFVAADALDIVDTALDLDVAITSTAAGNALGQPIVDLTEAAGTTTVKSLQPLLGTAVERVTALRTALLGGAARESVDRAAYDEAHADVLDQCALLLDPLAGR